ncbi:N-acetyl-1-D-myo-inositol-2-amino-2-deoxy-alpha-D-glucopyranoside deacetylase [Sphaerisporangium sp. TRM90804]|uniref:N-acetyl-1-D-myo-inositol-2-amino-2-deoxy-alpha- D-glucopyranoside deacetylase n=1 Tax=Sphaerisporangium sp. TRM90804 TaxID=3031113 RepID=UPI00244CD374|nr:N-acetyl-1-D-myo-inositol-2-amino-2-deoxy-alpha-D-glucopyranoside deacetylase [Sphaerisporangium sp. TRM90804]MDH2429899.1 N-acetyl-1-D-myo-inositol-2-amino-2-deoxy-alpha-D-glucopyranoside deacetylase [Sphaerisporangium sp. TRM90804]
MADRRLLLVHAHPDDESIATGATMAKYAAEGAQVTLVTCTLGEEGEVVVPDLAHLAVDREDRLGPHRVGELDAACEALGVKDHRFLGGPGRWRDSGMMGLPTNDHPQAFWRADLDEAAGELVAIIREVRPQVLVTYDENGFYGHPDHIQAYRVSWRAFELAADPSFGEGEPWQVAKFYFTAMPRSFIRRVAASMRGTDLDFLTEDAADVPPFGSPDEEITTEVDARPFAAAKLDAMRAHRSQIALDAPWFVLADRLGMDGLGVEHYILKAGARGPAAEGPSTGDWGLGEPHDREDDLFVGVG